MRTRQLLLLLAVVTGPSDGLAGVLQPSPEMGSLLPGLLFQAAGTAAVVAGVLVTVSAGTPCDDFLGDYDRCSGRLARVLGGGQLLGLGVILSGIGAQLQANAIGLPWLERWPDATSRPFFYWVGWAFGAGAFVAPMLNLSPHLDHGRVNTVGMLAATAATLTFVVGPWIGVKVAWGWSVEPTVGIIDHGVGPPAVVSGARFSW